MIDEDWNEWYQQYYDDFYRRVSTDTESCVHQGDKIFFGVVPCRTSMGEVFPIPTGVKAWVALSTFAFNFFAKGNGECIDFTKIKTLYADVCDMNVPSVEQTNTIFRFIVENVKDGNVMLTCQGGHGRTGMILAIWCALNGIKNPIEYVREKYCSEAIETLAQERFIYEFMGWDVPIDIERKIEEEKAIKKSIWVSKPPKKNKKKKNKGKRCAYCHSRKAKRNKDGSYYCKSCGIKYW